jgi:anti-sigma-K factor RskA
LRSGLFTTESYAIGYAAAWQARLSGLDAEVAEVAPRAAVKTGLEQRLFGLPPRACLWQRAGLWQGVSLASLVVAAFFAVQSLQLLQAPIRGPCPATLGNCGGCGAYVLGGSAAGCERRRDPAGCSAPTGAPTGAVLAVGQVGAL